MFNVTNNITKTARTEHVPFCKEIHEFKAPTDDSIKILNEMQDKVIQNILARGHTIDNTLNASWFVHADDKTRSTIFVCRFVLNGQNYDFEFNISSLGTRQRYIPMEGLADELINKITEKVSSVLLVDGLRNEIGKTLRTLQPEME